MLGFTLITGVSCAAAGFDPINIEARTASAPDRPWVADQPLPPVPVPATMRGLPPELERPLSLAELTDLALRLNAKTRQAWLQARAEAATLGIERADEWPQLSALVSARRLRAVSATTGSLGNLLETYGPNVALSYILYDFGQREADIEAANYRLLAANLAQNRVLQEVAFQVEQAYYRVLAFDNLVRASRQSLKNFETALDATQRRRSSGLATAGDEYRAETQVGQSRLVLTRNQGESSKARGLLANAVGLPVNVPLQLRSLAETPPVLEITQSMNALLDKAKSRRPDLIAAEARARAARAGSQAISRAGLPSLEFSANYGRIFYADSHLPLQDSYNLGFNVRIPLFSGFRDTYSRARAQAVADQAENARDQLYSQTELDVWQAYFDLQTAASSVASTAKLVISAAESAAAASARYQSGMGSLLDFITAQLDETNAQVQRIQSYLDWYSALARLNFALGAADSAILRTNKP